MALTPLGFDGSIGESEFALFMQLAGYQPCVGGLFDFRVSQVAGQRAVAIAAGRAHKNGVWVQSTASESRTLPVPDAGQWSLIVIRRNWQTNLVTLEVLPGATTSAALPVSAPTLFPGTYRVDTGVVEDQEIAWVWASSASTTVTIIDLRKQPASFRGSGTVAERTAAFGSPTSVVQRRALQLSGVEWVRPDKGWTERYFADYAADFPGGVLVGDAGWYPVTGKLPYFTARSAENQPFGINANAWNDVKWYDSPRDLYQDHGGFGRNAGSAFIELPFAGRWDVEYSARWFGQTSGITRGMQFIFDGKLGPEELRRSTSGYSGASFTMGVSGTEPIKSTVYANMYQDSGAGLNVDLRRLSLTYLGPA
jgi:hypothetical protein